VSFFHSLQHFCFDFAEAVCFSLSRFTNTCVEMALLRLDVGLRLDTGLHFDSQSSPSIHKIKPRKRMINLNEFFQNPFNAEDISYSRLLNFSARSLGRMSINNPGGLLDAPIAALTAALSSTESGVSDVGIKAAIRLAKTQAKAGFREGLAATLRRVHGGVAAAYGDPSPELSECFPQGRTIYLNCKDEELDNKLDQLVACITPLQAQVGAAVVGLATTAKTQWAAIYSAQGSAKDAHELTTEARDQAKLVLTAALFDALLFVARQYPGDVVKCDYYFPQQLLRRPTARTVPAVASLTADPFDSVTRKVLLHGASDGAEQIRIERRMQGETDFSVLAEVASEDGVADYEDTLVASGNYEYRATGLNGASAGEASPVLVVQAA
jgi:hypothetical protein